MMTQANSNSTLQELDSLIRAGDIAAVVGVLRKTNIKQIQRPEMVRYANIANRVGDGRMTLRLLEPIVRSTNLAITAPTDLEKIEYAGALRLLGLIDEAISILQEIDAQQIPITLLRIAFCLMNQWRYNEAISYLERFLGLTEPDDYHHLVASVNLAAALIFELREDDAFELLSQVKVKSKSSGQQLLYGNCLELSAQLLVRQKRCAEADLVLEEAATLFSENSRYSLYLKKWLAISQSIRHDMVHPDLIKCRAEAEREMEWETARECDFYIGFLARDPSLLSQVYFGTPYTSYRKKVRNLAGNLFSPGEQFIWNQHPHESVTEVFDIVSGKVASPARVMERGRLMHRLMIHLASDFYRPQSVGSLFSELFPGEHFAQQGSNDRVFQLVRRLRIWFKKAELAIEVVENRGQYRLLAAPGIGIYVPQSIPKLTSEDVSWNKLSRNLQSRSFSKTEVMNLLDCSNATAKRLLRWATTTGHAEAFGESTQRRYRLAG